MGELTRSMRLLCGAAAFTVLGVGAAACSSGSTSSQSLPAPTTAATTIAPATTPAAVVAAATTAVGGASEPVAASPTSPIDGVALLQGAIAAMAGGYHFSTTLTVDGAVVLTADGDRVGDGTRLGVTQGDVSVQYVITPAGTWVQPEGGDWQQLDAESASTDPIAALATPSAVEVVGVDGPATTVNAAVPAAALGLGGGDAVTMSARIENGAITSVGYNTAIDGKAAVMQASIGPVVDGSPVVAPV